MTKVFQFRLLNLGSAKALTQAQQPSGLQEGVDITDCWG